MVISEIEEDFKNAVTAPIYSSDKCNNRDELGCNSSDDETVKCDGTETFDDNCHNCVLFNENESESCMMDVD